VATRKTRSNATGRRLRHAATEHARNYSQIAYEYARAAVRDKRGKTYCKWVQLAAKRQLDDLRKARKRDYPYLFEAWHANDVCDFIEKLTHVQGQWAKPTITLEPAQVFILACVFGWRRRSDGNRRFTVAYIEMARKGAKSTVSGGVALYCLTCDGEVGPEIVIGATTGDQANKVFKPAKLMVERNRDLREAFGVQPWSRSITCRNSAGSIQPINAKSSTQDGWNPHVGILDELHAHKDRGLFDVLKSSFGARRNSLLWIITTAGYNVLGVCYEQRKLVTKLLEGVFELDHYFGIIYTLDDGDRPLTESKWIKANPLLGITPTLESMQAYAKEARASPESMGEFRTKRLNIWTNAKSGWLNMESWKQCAGTVDPNALKDVRAFGGLDLASVSDMTVFALIWLLEGRLKVWCRYYMPEDMVAPRTERGNVPYQVWAKQGLLTLTPGNVTDYQYIERDVIKALDTFQIEDIGFDKWNAWDLVNRLTEAEAPMIEFRQGPRSFNAPMRQFERHLNAATLDHGDDPVLAWMASNIVARQDINKNMAPDKKNSQEKIDGIVAILMALGLAMLHTESKCVYEQRELFVI